MCTRRESGWIKTAILSPRKDLDLDLILGIQSSAACLSYQLVRAAVNYIHLQCKVSISYDQLSGFRLWVPKDHLASSTQKPFVLSITSLASFTDCFISCGRWLSDKSARVVFVWENDLQTHFTCLFLESVATWFNPRRDFQLATQLKMHPKVETWCVETQSPQ